MDMMDSFEKNDKDNQQHFLSPAAKLFFSTIPEEYKDRILTGLVNEAMIAREILSVNRTNKTIGIIEDTKHLGFYAEVRLDVDDVFREAGSSSETIRMTLENDEVDRLLEG